MKRVSLAWNNEVCVCRAEASKRSIGQITHVQGRYLSKLGRGFQVLLEAAEGRIVVLEVCARGLAAAAAQIAGHVMRNVVVELVFACGIAGGGCAAGRDARLGIEVRRIDRIVLYGGRSRS